MKKTLQCKEREREREREREKKKLEPHNPAFS
jgi:hypothetical protein